MSGAPAEPSPAVMARDAAPSSGWLTGCCLPCVASPFLDAALLLAPVCCGLSSYLGMERTQAANHNDLALWSLQHPGRGAGCPWYCGFGCGLPIGAVFRWWTYLDGSIPLTVNVEYGLFARSNGRTPYLRREAWFGKYFGFTGKLTLADGDRMDAMLEGAMDRGEYLGPHPLTNMPSFSDGSTSFPLALPSGHCPMNTGAHATFIAMFQRYFWNAEARARLAPDNEVARRAEAELATGFAAAVSLYERAPAKFAAGWSGRDLAFIDVYLTRPVFWGMLGVDIGAAGTPEYELAMWAQDKVNLGASYFTIYDVVPSRLVSLLGLNRDKLRRLHELVQGCDALRDFAPESSTDGWVDEREGRTAQMLVDDLNGASPRCVSKEEFVAQLVPVLIMAALQGPKTLGRTIASSHFGGIRTGRLASAEEEAYPLCPPPGFAFPYGSRAKLQLVVLETLRVNLPVYETVGKLAAPLSVADYAGRGPQTFPKGCPVLLSYPSTSASSEVYGDSALTFDPTAHAGGLQERLNGFNGVGTAGRRLCPGRDLSLEMLVSMLEVFGRVQRRQAAASAA